ncbi:MAG: hypothetical protein HS111_28790 [Kofleriaceae bacterium]|nr:hypothetical protein [Kofleriaceae bacterium]
MSFTVVADDTLKGLGSLSSPIAVAATGPTGLTVAPSSGPSESTLGDGRRQLMVSYDTAAVSAAVGDGALAVTFAVTDSVGAGRAARGGADDR